MTKADGLNDDGGCSVDWSWLAGERVASVRNGLETVTITFASGLELTISARLWQGKAFLAFDPYRDPRARPPG